MKKIIVVILAFILCGCSTTPSQVKKEEVKDEVVEKPKVEKTEIAMNFVGDITLGNFLGMSYDRSFDQLYKNNDGDKTYFLKNVKSTFEKDDLTIGNLEGTLTTATKHPDKRYIFKGKPEYAQILKKGNVDIVSLANNHSGDYLEKGREETKKNLDKENIEHFGYEDVLIKEVKGKKIGFIGYSFASQTQVPSNIKEQMTKAVNTLKDKTDIIVVYYHWGMMYEYVPRESQVELAHYTIDLGADLVVGTHAHVIQGMETYKGKNIVYSLGNFCYGGNLNPKDTDSMIFQQKFVFEDNQLIDSVYQVIPCALSSHKNKRRNNFQPMILDGSEKERWEKKFKKYSKQIPS